MLFIMMIDGLAWDSEPVQSVALIIQTTDDETSERWN